MRQSGRKAGDRMNRRIAENSTRREFLRQAAVGGAVALMTPTARVLGANEMVTGRSEESAHYFPEKINQPRGESLTGGTPDKNHMANWLGCIRSRQTPNAPVELGHRSAVAAHMANITYREKRRVTLEEARAWLPR
jgi:hypothetical protein